MRNISPRHLLCLLAFLLFPPALLAQTMPQDTAKADKKTQVSTNFGAKAGFTAALSLFSAFQVDGMPIDQLQNNYKVGYFASLFMRINFNRHFIQPEISYNVNQCGITFNKPVPEDAPIGTINAGTASIESKMHSIDIPIIYGYNFIKQGPYAMSVFGGPKIRYIWRKKSETRFFNFDQPDLEEKLYPLSLSFTVGVAVTISRIFFDFRYDIGLFNLTHKVSSTAETSSENTAITYRRRDNVLSFSLGVFF